MFACIKHDMIPKELACTAYGEYLEDVVQHMKLMEVYIASIYWQPAVLTQEQVETLPDVNLIDMQPEIRWFMRPYLLDFLIEAHAGFSLLPETLFLTVNLLDRYCSKRAVHTQQLQLVGCAALLIAAKYGDKKVRVPQINELKTMCCGLYDAAMFTQMEMHILNSLEWNIGHPTVHFFIQLTIAERRDDPETEHMAAYLCEIALYHRDFVSTKPSTMARSSVALARTILGRPEVNEGEWDHVETATSLTLSQNLRQPSVALVRKYSSPTLSGVSGKLADFLSILGISPTPGSHEVVQNGSGANTTIQPYWHGDSYILHAPSYQYRHIAAGAVPASCSSEQSCPTCRAVVPLCTVESCIGEQGEMVWLMQCPRCSFTTPFFKNYDHLITLCGRVTVRTWTAQ